MRIFLDVPDFEPGRGLQFEWDDGFAIAVKVSDEGVTISANAGGLRSLARQMLLLAQEPVPVGHHIHFDELSPLEPGSTSLIVEKAVLPP